MKTEEVQDGAEVISIDMIGNSCTPCFFNHKDCVNVNCFPDQRDDNRSVYFANIKY